MALGQLDIMCKIMNAEPSYYAQKLTQMDEI